MHLLSIFALSLCALSQSTIAGKIKHRRVHADFNSNESRTLPLDYNNKYALTFGIVRLVDPEPPTSSYPELAVASQNGILKYDQPRQKLDLKMNSNHIKLRRYESIESSKSIVHAFDVISGVNLILNRDHEEKYGD